MSYAVVSPIAIASTLAVGGGVGVAPLDVERVTSPRPLAAAGRTLFLNFEGVTLRLTESFDEDDAVRDTSWLFGGTFARYGEDASQAAIEQAVRGDWAAYDLEVVVDRPHAGPYVMAVVTPTNPVGDGIVGYAPVDCGDSRAPSNIIFAFHDPSDGYSVAARATTVSQEVAHSFGLEHIDEPTDIMNPIVGATADPSFTDGCHPTTGSAFCGAQHAELCGDPGRQNSHQELLAILGPATPDTTPPWGRVVEPADGSMLAMGDPLRVVVEAGDDNAVRSVVLYDGGESLGIGRVAPYTWTLPSPARGTHELYALVTDHAGHEALTEVALVGVGELPADSPTPNLPGRPGGPPLPGREDVTGCAVGRTGGAPAWWTLFVVLLAAHRTLRGVRVKFRATARRDGRRAPVHGEATQGSA